MSKESKLAKRILQSINEEKSSKSTFYSLNHLIEELENKVDPSPVEINIVESLYKYVEDLKILESNLNYYLKEENKSLPGNKLSSLYERTSKYGTSVLFS